MVETIIILYVFGSCERRPDLTEDVSIPLSRAGPEKIPSQAGFEPEIFSSRGGRLSH